MLGTRTLILYDVVILFLFMYLAQRSTNDIIESDWCVFPDFFLQKKYDILLLIGLAIRATPFISVLKNMLNNLKSNKVIFLYNAFEQRLYAQILAENISATVHLHIHDGHDFRGATPEYDLGINGPAVVLSSCTLGILAFQVPGPESTNLYPQVFDLEDTNNPFHIHHQEAQSFPFWSTWNVSIDVGSPLEENQP
ncbi:hypothetical protein ACJX0J_013379, partial [Zea mays]